MLECTDICAIETIDGSRTVNLVEQHVVDPFVSDLVAAAATDETTLLDLELFDAYVKDEETVFDSVDFTTTHGGAAVLRSVMARPIVDIAALERRRDAVRAVSDVYDRDEDRTERLLKTMHDNVDTVAWFMHGRTDEENALFDMVYFSKRFLKRLNGSRACLDGMNMYRMYASPAIGILSPILYFLIPYLIIRFKCKERIGFVEYIKIMFEVSSRGLAGSTKATFVTYIFSMVVYFQSIFTTVEVSTTLHRIVRIITERCISLTDFVESAQELCAMYSPLEIEAFGFASRHWDVATQRFETYDGAGVRVPSLDVRAPFTVKNALLGRARVGAVLVKFREFDYRAIVPLMLRAFVVDALVSVVKATRTFGMCYAEHLRGDRPVITARGMWHISIPYAVRNDVSVGGERPNNMIITGPNAGGKSTLVKSVFVNLLLSQTLGVAAATAFAHTPFDVVSTQMNVPDCKGKESLFEAEMNRCKRKLDLVGASRGRLVALAFDEIFSSTEPTEGVAGAFAIASSLSRHENVVTFITTHYRYLCKLADEEDFAACKM